MLLTESKSVGKRTEEKEKFALDTHRSVVCCHLDSDVAPISSKEEEVLVPRSTLLLSYPSFWERCNSRAAEKTCKGDQETSDPLSQEAMGSYWSTG